MSSPEELKRLLDEANDKIKNIKFVLGSVIFYLQREIGTKNCEDLLAELSGETEGDL